MQNNHYKLDDRQALDKYLHKLARISSRQPPRMWLRTVRKALGMNSAQFGRRLGVSQTAAAALERSERDETIKLGTLRRAAEALDCRLVYAVVPRGKLSLALRDRQMRLAEKDLCATVAGFNRLPMLTQMEAIHKAAQKIPAKRVWDEWIDDEKKSEEKKEIAETVRKKEADDAAALADFDRMVRDLILTARKVTGEESKTGAGEAPKPVAAPKAYDIRHENFPPGEEWRRFYKEKPKGW